MTDTPRTVLLIDNDLFFPSKLEALLMSDGFVVKTVDYVDLDSVAADPPHAILVNFGQSSEQRAQLVKRLKSHPETKCIPVIAFAGHVEIGLQRLAREAGADKVVANSAIVSHPGEVIGRTGTKTLEFGDPS